MLHAIETIGLTRVFKRTIYKKSATYVTDNNPAAFFMTMYYRYLYKKNIRTRIKAVDNVNIKVKKGEILCLLGPNGSGKTTLLKIISGLLNPTSGKVLIEGVEASNLSFYELVRYVTYIPGIMSGGSWINPFLTARKNLQMCAGLYNLRKDKVDEALRMTGLIDLSDAIVGTFSSGMFARLVLAAGLMKESPIYLMDEPMLGLSRELALELLSHIKHLCKDLGATILYATNTIEEAERLADRVAIMKDGKIVAMGSLQELVNEIKENEIIEIEVKNPIDVKRLAEKLAIDPSNIHVDTEASGSAKDIMKFRIRTGDSRSILPRLVDAIVNSDAKLLFVRVREPNLEDIFIKVLKLQAEG